MSYYELSIHSSDLEEINKYQPLLVEELLKLPAFNNDSKDLLMQGITKCDWTGAVEDVVEISKKLPEAILYLYCEGKDAHDVWIAYIQNGEYHIYTAEVNFPDLY